MLLFVRGNVHHDAAEFDGLVALRDHADNVSQPDGSPVGGDDAIFKVVAALFPGGANAELQGPIVIVGVEVVRPEIRHEPLMQGIAQQALGLLAHEREAERSGIGFPYNTINAGHQLLILQADIRKWVSTIGFGGHKLPSIWLFYVPPTYSCRAMRGFTRRLFELRYWLGLRWPLTRTMSSAGRRSR